MRLAHEASLRNYVTFIQLRFARLCISALHSFPLSFLSLFSLLPFLFYKISLSSSFFSFSSLSFIQVFSMCK